jgi:hypothetical protein
MLLALLRERRASYVYVRVSPSCFSTTRREAPLLDPILGNNWNKGFIVLQWDLASQCKNNLRSFGTHCWATIGWKPISTRMICDVIITWNHTTARMTYDAAVTRIIVLEWPRWCGVKKTALECQWAPKGTSYLLCYHPRVQQVMTLN